MRCLSVCKAAPSIGGSDGPIRKIVDTLSFTAMSISSICKGRKKVSKHNCAEGRGMDMERERERSRMNREGEKAMAEM